jgi:hypothetical protein
VTPACLPVVTGDCFLISGCGLGGVTAVKFGDKSLSPTGAFGAGSFKVLSDRKLQVCPPLCLPGGKYLITFGNGSGAFGSVMVSLVEPTSPTISCEATHPAGTVQCVFLDDGNTGKTLQFTIISPDPTPSVAPGIVHLAIGNNFTNFLCGPGVNGPCVKDVVGTIPLTLVGHSLFFQSIVVDPAMPALPLMTSNVCETRYV